MGSFSDYRCLIVDPDPFMRRLVREMLRFVGITEVEIVPDAAQALHLLFESPFDVVVTELALTGLRSVEMISQIRRSKRAFDNALPVVGYTAVITPDLVIGARDAGINEIMAKPFSAAILSKRLEAALISPRPFVRSAVYVGPCRRRKDKPGYVGPFRREADRLAEQARIKAAREAADQARLAAQQAARDEAEQQKARQAAQAAAAALAAAPKPVPPKPASPKPASRVGAMSQEELAKSLGSGKDRQG